MIRNFKAALFVILTVNIYCADTDEERYCATGIIDNDSQTLCQQLTGEKGFAMRCNNTKLTSVPSSYLGHGVSGYPMCLLDLSENSIENINDEAFSNKANLNVSNILWLYLHNNSIKRIEAKAFAGLVNLIYLNLSHNNLEWTSGMASGLFLPLRSLQYLNIKANNFRSFAGMDMELKVLRNLTSLLVNPKTSDYEFGPGFQYLTNLQNLSLSGMDGNTCNMSEVSNRTFENLTQLKVLFMSDCSISKIEANAFEPLTGLEHLDISYNYLKFEGMNVALYSLRNSSTLQTLKVHSLYKQEGLGIVLHESHFEHISTMHSITEIYMDINKIEIIDKNIFIRSLIPPTLRKLTLCGNRLATGDYVNYLSMVKNITILNLSRQFLVIDPFLREQDQWKVHPDLESRSLKKRSVSMPNRRKSDIHSVSVDNSKGLEIIQVSQMNSVVSHPCNCSQRNSRTICLPPNLQTLIWRRSFLFLDIYHTEICNGDNLKTIDLSCNLIKTWSGPVLGLRGVTNLNMAECNGNRVYEHFFSSFPNLKTLNISNNNLFISFDIKFFPNATRIFSTQSYIESLDLSCNILYTLPDNLFENTINLKKLYLRRNLFLNFTIDLRNTKIEHLDLSDNKLSTLPPDLLDFLDESSTQRNVSLEYSYNKIDCSSCDSLHFLKWLKHTKVKVAFADDDNCKIGDKHYYFTNKDDIDRIINNLTYDKLCLAWVKWGIIGGYVLLGWIMSAVIGVASYRNRWKLRYYYYNRKRRYIHQGFEHIFSYDAYISYAKGKATFVYNAVAPKLEEQHGLKLWIADRDSTAGISVAENIVYGIGNSRKTVLLVDDEYLEDNWCDYDMNMALIESIQTNREAIIIVLMTSCGLNEIPVSILRALNQQHQIEYPDNPRDLETFWMNLASDINK